jgi:SAM-dependent methyltransferase
MTSANEATPMRVNVGCGATPTRGWLNLDGSLTVRLARVPGLIPAAHRLGLVTKQQLAFTRVVQEAGIRPANAARRLPLSNSSVEVLYTSHMVEHLTRVEARRFLAEAFRVLRPGGFIRVAVPNLGLYVARYLDSTDADAFIEGTLLGIDAPRGPLQRVKSLLTGSNGHMWMYDEASALRLLSSGGFVDGEALRAGQTTIPDPGALDLHERDAESLYVEARKPAHQST